MAATDSLLTLQQALQLLALGPCLFLLAALPLALRQWREAVVPTGFFLCLTASIALPVLATLGLSSDGAVAAWLMLLQLQLAPLTFLLVLQVVRQEPPSFWLSLICLLPLGWWWLQGGMMLSDPSVLVLGNIIITALLLLALILYLQQQNYWQEMQRISDNRFWVVTALLGVLLALGVVELLALAGQVAFDKAALAQTLLKLTFLYTVLTLLFRVQQEQFALHLGRVPTAARYLKPSDENRQLAEKLDRLLVETKLYEQTRLSRTELAKKLNCSEAALSQAVNRTFEQNLSQRINYHRCEAAKDRLRNEDTQVTIIAYDVGFNSLATFNRAFKEHERVAPTTYRKRNA